MTSPDEDDDRHGRCRAFEVVILGASRRIDDDGAREAHRSTMAKNNNAIVVGSEGGRSGRPMDGDDDDDDAITFASLSCPPSPPLACFFLGYGMFVCVGDGMEGHAGRDEAGIPFFPRSTHQSFTRGEYAYLFLCGSLPSPVRRRGPRTQFFPGKSLSIVLFFFHSRSIFNLPPHTQPHTKARRSHSKPILLFNRTVLDLSVGPWTTTTATRGKKGHFGEGDNIL